MNNSLNFEKVQKLLCESREANEKLQNQQEELRVTNEELENQSTALMNSQSELEAQQENLRIVNEELEENSRYLEDQRIVLEEKNQELLASQKTIEEKTEDLILANKYKSEFLANMSHELRSPLTVIRGGVDYLNRTVKGAEKRSYLDIIDKNLSRLIHLVSDLFDFTKIEAKKIELSFDREDVCELVQEVAEILSPVATDKRVSISYEYLSDIYAEIDVERIEQVLINLIENAIKFSDPETEIEIEVQQDKDNVVVSVKNRGLGIPEENLEVIFKKFHTLPSSDARRKNEGTGLGLAICKGIIGAHNGRIWVESVKGEFATFYFTLPKQRL